MATYDGVPRDAWVDELKPQNEWNYRHLLLAFALLGKPASMLDVGCGLGSAVEAAHNLGVLAFGVDQLINYESDYFFHANLVEKFLLEEKVNLVWCTEVGEHLDASAHATLCDTLAENLLEGRENYLVFSSAYPNQGGTGHLAERPAKYWKDQFALRDLNFRKDLTVNLSLLWSNIGSPLYWLPANVLVFEK